MKTQGSQYSSFQGVRKIKIMKTRVINKDKLRWKKNIHVKYKMADGWNVKLSGREM